MMAEFVKSEDRWRMNSMTYGLGLLLGGLGSLVVQIDLGSDFVVCRRHQQIVLKVERQSLK